MLYKTVFFCLHMNSKFYEISCYCKGKDASGPYMRLVEPILIFSASFTQSILKQCNFLIMKSSVWALGIDLPYQEFWFETGLITLFTCRLVPLTFDVWGISITDYQPIGCGIIVSSSCTHMCLKHKLDVDLYQRLILLLLQPDFQSLKREKRHKPSIKLLGTISKQTYCL